MVQSTVVVIVGAGFGGLECCRQLHSLLGDSGEISGGNVEIVLIEPKDEFAIGGGFQYLMNGRLAWEDVSREYKFAKLASNVKAMFGYKVTSVETEAKKLSIRRIDGSKETEEIRYDYLVLNPGIESKVDAVPGAASTLLDICSKESYSKIKEQVGKLTEGTVLIMISGVPYKCPPAPFEYAFLVETMLREQGVRDKCTVILTCPKGPFPFGSPETARIIKTEMALKGIEFRVGIQPSKVRTNDNVVEFKPFMDSQEKPCEIKFDVLIGTHPQKCSDTFLPLCNAKGFIDADVTSLETADESVFALGDASWLMLPSNPPKPHPKSGDLARFEAGNAMAMLAELIKGKSREEARAAIPSGRKAACYLEAGDGRAIQIQPKLLPDEEGGTGFMTSEPDEKFAKAKVEWLKMVLDLYFEDPNAT